MDTLKALRYVIDDKERKSLIRIGVEAAHCALIEREVPLYYFTSLLHQKDSGDYRKFIGHRHIARINTEFYQQGGDHSALQDKYEFARILTRHEIPTPKILARSRGRGVDVSGEEIPDEDRAGLGLLLRDIIRQSRDGVIFVKPVDGIGGKNTFKLSGYVAQDDIERLYALMLSTTVEI